MSVRLFHCLILLPVVLLLTVSTTFAGNARSFYFTTRDGLAGDFITAIAPRSDSDVWIGTTEGATHIEPERWTSYTRAHGLGDSWITGIDFTADERVWFGTQSGGVSVLDPKTKTFETYNLDDSDIPSNFITALAASRKNQIWIGTLDQGVASFDLSKEIWTQYNFPKSAVTFLDTDFDGRVYVGTESEGAFIFFRDKWEPLLVPVRGRVNRIESEGDGCPIVVTDEGSACPNQLLENYLNPYYKNAEQILKLSQSQITALAGALVGTTRGLYLISDVNSLSRTNPLPVVLVHGWTVAGNDTLETSEFRFLKSYADRDGIPMFYVRGVSPKNSLYQNAAVIRDEIARVKNETGAAQVNVIAFSMGGMNTRAYLESSLYANDVNRAIILGTPQAGVEIWKPILFQQILQKPDEPSAIELSPEYARMIVNETRSPNPNVAYDVLIGDAREQVGLDFLDDMPASDALISVDSALALDIPMERKHINADLHDWGPEPVPLDLTGYLFPRETWERYLRNALRNNDNAPFGSEISQAPSHAVGQSEVPQGNHTPVVTKKIRAGETLTETIVIDENKSARFVAYFPGGHVDVSLRDPNGKLYERSDLPREDDSGVLSLSTDIASFSGYVVKDAAVGEWQMILKRTDERDETIEVSAYAELNAPLRLNAFSRWQTIDVGATNTITGFVAINSGDTLRDVKMTARIAQPSAKLGEPFTFTELELFDDGNHNDGAANDGFFADDYTPSRAGWYPVFVQTQGKNFARESEFLFAASEGGATIVEVTPKPIKEQTATSHETLVTVNVERAGEYLISVESATSSGRVLAQVFPLSLKQGTYTLVEFLSDDFFASDQVTQFNFKLLDARWAAIPIFTLADAFGSP